MGIDIIEEDDGLVNIDLMAALMLLTGIIIVAIYTVPEISYGYNDWRVKQYTVAVRATDGMVQSEGDSIWINIWKSGNYSNVQKIGFIYVNNTKMMSKVLDINKVITLMGNGTRDNLTNLTWWEFPSDEGRDVGIIDNASRALGLNGYDFYIQLHPVGISNFDPITIDTNLRKRNLNSDTVTVVDRYVYILDPSVPEEIKYIKYDNEAVHYRLSLWIK